MTNTEQVAKQIIIKIVENESAVVYSGGHFHFVKDKIVEALVLYGNERFKKGLERAAFAMCQGCKNGWPFVKSKENWHQTESFIESEHSGMFCQAQPIRNLILEEPKP